MAATPSIPAKADLDALVSDLLRDIPRGADRPALVEHARHVARAQLWIRDFDRVMEAAIRDGQGDYLAIVERLQRMKERESAMYARGMLILDMLRDHGLPVQARVVATRRRPRRRRS
jgi:hypothetical protein